MDLLQKKCAPCDGSVKALDPSALAPLMSELDGWRLENQQKIHKELKFKDFAQAMLFVNALAYVAEREGHHPDFFVHGWNKVTVTLWTHDVGGLSENDFIVAAKLDALLR